MTVVWKPKFQEGDTVFPFLPANNSFVKIGFCARGKVIQVREDGFYRVRIEKVYLDNYYMKGLIHAGSSPLYHFDWVEKTPMERGIIQDIPEEYLEDANYNEGKEKVQFT